MLSRRLVLSSLAVRPRHCRMVSAETKEKLQLFAEKQQTSVSLNTLMHTGMGLLLPDDADTSDQDAMRCQTAAFLHRELPVRLAHRVRDLQDMPHGLSGMPSVVQVRHWYEESFEEIVSLKQPTTSAEEIAVAEALSNIFTRHADTLIMMARGLWEFRKDTPDFDTDIFLPKHDDIHQYYDDFFVSRIGIRVLIQHYLELRKGREESAGTDYVGIINVKTSAFEVARAAIQDARYICDREEGEAPRVNIVGRTDLTFSYVPSHLYYMLTELLKNSMRATCEKHRDADVLPDIQVIIADGESNSDVVIKVADQGGGIPRSDMNKLFNYHYTTAKSRFADLYFDSLTGSADMHDFGRGSPLAGLGYGLPISRNYARYFGGDLVIVSMEGHGTDAYLHLSRLGDNSEPLP